MEILKKIWGKMSGKKFNTGSFILFVAVVLNEVVVGIWEINPFWMGNVISTLNWCGMAITGTGLAHRIQKGELKKKRGN